MKLAQWGERVFIKKNNNNKYVVMANMWHIRLGHGNWRNLKSLKLPCGQCQPCGRRSYGQHAIQSWRKSKKSATEKKGKNKKKKRKKERLMHCPLHVCLFFFLNKNKSSSPQDKHNLTSKFSGMMEEKRNTACMYNQHWSSLFCHTNWKQKSSLNKTRLTVN